MYEIRKGGGAGHLAQDQAPLFAFPGEAVQSGGVRGPGSHDQPGGPALLQMVQRGGNSQGKGEQVLPVCKNQLIAVVRSGGLLKEGQPGDRSAVKRRVEFTG